MRHTGAMKPGIIESEIIGDTNNEFKRSEAQESC